MVAAPQEKSSSNFRKESMKKSHYKLPDVEEEITPELLNRKIMALLQFARKAGKLIHGYETCKKHIQNRKIDLLVLAGDLSAQTRTKIVKSAQIAESRIPIKEFSTQEELGSALGLPYTGIIGILDKNFAGKILSYIEQ